MNLRHSVFDSAFARILRSLAGGVCRHPKWFVVPQLVLFAVCVVYTATQLQFDMSRDNLVGANKKYHQVFMRYRKEFPGEDEMAVVVQSGDLERNRQFIERLAAKLEAETNLFTDVFYKGDLKALGPKALLFAPESDLTEMRRMLNDYRPFIQEFTRATNLDSLFNLINRQFRTAKQETNAENNSMVKALPALQRIIDQATASLSMPGTPVSPGIDALFGQGGDTEQRIYITFDHGRIYLVTARAPSEEVVPQAVERLRKLIRQTSFEVPGVNVGLTGQPVLDYDEMQQSQHDSALASVVSLIICSLIFIYAYREAWRPLKAIACLIIGLGYSMGFTTLTVGHLNILTITFAPILIGLAIDFGIHFITRYEEEMRAGRTTADAIDKAMVFTGQGIVTGALTTAAAFLAMALTDFKGIQEMGIISGGGLVLCLVPMMTLLPVFLMHGKQNEIDRQKGPLIDKRAQIEELWLQRPIPVVLIVLALCVAAASQFHRVYFDYDLLHMQSQSLPSVIYEKKLLFSGRSIMFAALEADSLQQAREFEQKAKALPAVASVDGDDKGTAVFELLTSDQTQKLKTVDAIKNELASLRFARIDTNAVRLEELGATLWSTMGYCSLASNTVSEMQSKAPAVTEPRARIALGTNSVELQDEDLARQLGGLHDAISAFRVKMLSSDPSIPGRLLHYQEALFNDVQSTFEAIKGQDAGSPLRPDDLPAVIRNRFVGVSGKKFRVLVFPKNDIWQHDIQEQFITQLRSVVPDPDEQVTDTPVQLLEYTTLLKNSYVQAAWYALAAIALMVLFHFRSIVCVILALLPVAIGTIWMGGIMGLSGIPFNPADIMTLPLVIGIGVTNGIHILNRFAEERHAGILAKSTGKAVLVSGLTATTGFGSLILAQHQGIRSLGLVMSIGIVTCMLAGLTFLPAVLNILVKWGWTMQTKRPSTDNARPLLGLEEPR